MEAQRPVFLGLDLSSDVLEQQGRALRALARSLLGDSHAAEDVVQEAWIATLDHRGRLPERFSAWIATVTRNLAHRRRRGDRRRHEREERVAGHRREAYEQHTLEHEEAVRAVTGALLALEEPFKSALIRRYFEERTPAEIADLTGVPLATVKSRLNRGLERLRERLDAEHGRTERRHALLVLAGAGAPTGGGIGLALGGGSIAMLAALAGAVVLVAGTAVFVQRGPGSERSGPTEARVAALAAAPGIRASEPAPAGAQEERHTTRTAPAPDSPVDVPVPTPAFEGASVFRLSGVLRDEEDQPLPGARVYAGPRGAPLAFVAEADDQGRFRVDLVGRRSSLGVVIAAVEGERWSGLHDLQLASNRPNEIDLLLDDPHLAAPEVEEAPETDAALRIDRLRAAIQAGGIRLDDAVAGGQLGDAPPLRADESGHAYFVAPLDRGGCPRPQSFRRDGSSFPLSISYEASHVPLLEFLRAERRFEPIGFEQLNLSVVELLRNRVQFVVESGPETWIEGIVRDASGQPVAEALVGYGRPGERFDGTTRSDGTGAFRLSLPPEEIHLRAGGGREGLASLSLTALEGDRLSWNPVLDPGAEVRGRIATPEGASPEGWRVELWSLGGALLWSDATEADSDGRFVIRNVARGPLLLALRPPGACLPARVLSPVFGGQDLGAIALADEDCRTTSVAVRFAEDEEDVWESATLRLWHLGSGLGAFLTRVPEADAFVLGGLPPGTYRLESSSARETRDLGTVHLAAQGEEPVDLGLVSAGSLGRFLLDVRGGSGEEREHVQLSLWRTLPEAYVHAFDVEGVAPRLHRLPPGDYLVCAARPGGAHTEAAFTVGTGDPAGLTLVLEGTGLSFRTGGERDPAWSRAEPAEREALAGARCTPCHSSGL